jgi:hypothetical protein
VARKAFVILFVLSLLLLAGCKEDALQLAEEQAVNEPVEKAPLTVASAPGPGEQATEQTPEEQEPAPEAPPAPRCGDGLCNGAENCDRCIKDCACVSPAECYQGRCKVPECGSDGDCRDNDSCTVDACYFAQHPNAYCAHELIEKCKNSDKCCPQGCDANTDSDCEPVCGNHVCEVGETEDSCEHDCPQQPDCGNQKCEQGEDAKSCPRDCL